jgi:hypothetical protein
LGQIVALVSPLLSLSNGFEVALANMPYRLLRHRLEEGPTAGWSAADVILSKALELPLRFPPAKTNFTLTLEALRKQHWGAAGKDLFVCASVFRWSNYLRLLKGLAISYLRTCLPFMDVDTLRTVKEAGLITDEGHEWTALLGEIDRQMFLMNTDLTTADEPHDMNLWRQKVRTLTQEIISPDRVTWMDDGEGFADRQFAQRAVDDIKYRFERLDRLCLTLQASC